MKFTEEQIETLGEGLGRLINDYLKNAGEIEADGDNGFMASTIHLPESKLAIMVMGPEMASFITRLSLVVPFCEDFFEELTANAAAHRIEHHVKNIGRCRHRHADPKRRHEVN